MSYKNIIFEQQDGIATITFNRPKSLNALNASLVSELSHALDQIAENEDIRCLIITGAGEKAFVAGADITEIATLSPVQGKLFSETGHKVIQKFEQLSIPVIAAVNGFALGGGTEIALGADFIYASENAKFGLPEINLGIIPGFGGTQRLSRLIGKNLAKEMIFTGKMLSAKEAQEIGIVNNVFSSEKLMEETLKTAKIIVRKGRVSIRAAKHAVDTGISADLATGCIIETNEFALCLASEDAKEGTSAFLEKRKAEFRGRLK